MRERREARYIASLRKIITVNIHATDLLSKIDFNVPGSTSRRIHAPRSELFDDIRSVG